MDPGKLTQYVEILKERQAAIAKGASDGHMRCQMICPEVASTAVEQIDANSSSSSGSNSHSDREETPIPTQYASLSDLDLLNVFTKLQSERIQVYSDYNGSLDIIIKEGQIGKYPTVCAEATSLFAVISKSIIDVKNTIISRGDKQNIASDIAALQSFEKEKLLLTAALHLDLIREKYPDLNIQYGNLVSDQPKNHMRKIDVLKERISSVMEKITSAKCDLLDSF